MSPYQKAGQERIGIASSCFLHFSSHQQLGPYPGFQRTSAVSSIFFSLPPWAVWDMFGHAAVSLCTSHVSLSHRLDLAEMATYFCNGLESLSPYQLSCVSMRMCYEDRSPLKNDRLCPWNLYFSFAHGINSAFLVMRAHIGSPGCTLSPHLQFL